MAYGVWRAMQISSASGCASDLFLPVAIVVLLLPQLGKYRPRSPSSTPFALVLPTRCSAPLPHVRLEVSAPLDAAAIPISSHPACPSYRIHVLLHYLPTVLVPQHTDIMVFTIGDIPSFREQILGEHSKS